MFPRSARRNGGRSERIRACAARAGAQSAFKLAIFSRGAFCIARAQRAQRQHAQGEPAHSFYEQHGSVMPHRFSGWQRVPTLERPYLRLTQKFVQLSFNYTRSELRVLWKARDLPRWQHLFRKQV